MTKQEQEEENILYKPSVSTKRITSDFINLFAHFTWKNICFGKPSIEMLKF